MVYARKTQKGSGSCFSKGQNRVSPLPILYDTNIVEFTPPESKSEVSEMASSSTRVYETDIPNYIPSIEEIEIKIDPSSIENLPDDLIREINDRVKSFDTKKGLSYTPGKLMFTSKRFAELLQPNSINKVVKTYFNSPEFKALLQVFTAGDGWNALCVYPIIQFEDNTYKTFEYYIEWIKPNHFKIYHFNTENTEKYCMINVQKINEDEDVENVEYVKLQLKTLIDEMQKCLNYIITNTKPLFTSLHFVIWADNFRINNDMPIHNPSQEEITSNKTLITPLTLTKEFLQNAVKIGLRQIIKNHNSTKQIPDNLSLAELMKEFSKLMDLEKEKIILFTYIPPMPGGVNHRRKLKLKQIRQNMN